MSTFTNVITENESIPCDDLYILGEHLKARRLLLEPGPGGPGGVGGGPAAGLLATPAAEDAWQRALQNPEQADPVQAGLARKNPPNKTQKNHLKNPLKMVSLFFLFFLGGFFKFLFFMKIIQTFLVETDFK